MFLSFCEEFLGSGCPQQPFLRLLSRLCIPVQEFHCSSGRSGLYCVQGCAQSHLLLSWTAEWTSWKEPTAPQCYPQSCLLLFLTKFPRWILDSAGHFTLSEITGLMMETSCQQPALLRHCGTVPCWVKSLPLPLCWSAWAPGSSSLMELSHSCCSLIKKPYCRDFFLIHLSPFVTCCMTSGIHSKKKPKKSGVFLPCLLNINIYSLGIQGEFLKLDIL